MAGAGVPTASSPVEVDDEPVGLPRLAMMAKTMMPMTSAPVTMANQLPVERCINRWPKVCRRRRRGLRAGVWCSGEGSLWLAGNCRCGVAACLEVGTFEEGRRLGGVGVFFVAIKGCLLFCVRCAYIYPDVVFVQFYLSYTVRRLFGGICNMPI